MADDTAIVEDDPFVRAGEYALGVLEGEERSAAQRSMLSDASFADAVAWWERRLGAMGEAAGRMLPSPSVWTGIEARLDADTPADVATMMEPSRGPSGWNIATAIAGLGAAAAALVLFLSTPETVETLPPDVALAPSEQFVAQLQDEEAGRRLAGVVDPQNRRLSLSIDGFTAGEGQAPELWVIPEGGAPVSLGSIPQSGNFARDLSAREAELLVAGSTLAVTFEEDTGLPHESPTPPILIAGALDQV